ncbi:MAG: DoxX family membrane protein [Proteobacteria bacterium]|nr:DoxX family membrane protein [Pseudomonadota bacterium]
MKIKIIHILHWVCRLFLGCIFIYAGYTKLDNSLQFAVAIEGYKLLSPNLVIWAIKILPWVEISLGAALLLGIMIRYTAALIGGLLALFIVVMLVTYLRGIEADCGCFGIGVKISPFTLVRDSFFILPALYLYFKPRIKK